LLFWGVAAVFVWQVVRRWRSLESPADRVLVAAALLALPLAVRTFRSVPSFVMLAAPALSRLTWPGVSKATSPAWRPTRRSLALLAPLLAVAALVVGRAWSVPWPMLGWRPISGPAASAIASCRPPLYNTYDGGGPIIWFVPGQPVFVDSRQDPFPVSLVQAASAVEKTGEYRALFNTWRINCAALPPASPTAARLAADGWNTRFRDNQWTVLERPVTGLELPADTGHSVSFGTAARPGSDTRAER
jgi:hypothetical protein